jgi:hypothetical protein
VSYRSNHPELDQRLAEGRAQLEARQRLAREIEHETERSQTLQIRMGQLEHALTHGETVSRRLPPRSLTPEETRTARRELAEAQERLVEIERRLDALRQQHRALDQAPADYDALVAAKSRVLEGPARDELARLHGELATLEALRRQLDALLGAGGGASGRLRGLAGNKAFRVDDYVAEARALLGLLPVAAPLLAAPEQVRVVGRLLEDTLRLGERDGGWLLGRRAGQIQELRGTIDLALEHGNDLRTRVIARVAEQRGKLRQLVERA